MQEINLVEDFFLNKIFAEQEACGLSNRKLGEYCFPHQKTPYMKIAALKNRKYSLHVADAVALCDALELDFAKLCTAAMAYRNKKIYGKG